MHRLTNGAAGLLIVVAGFASGCHGETPQACYSPTENVSTADQAGALGCACDPAVDQAVCVQGKALFCDYGHWSFGYDGPCQPGRDAGSSGDADGGDLTCGSPSCCVPIAVDPSRVYLSRQSDGGHVTMVLSLVTQPASFWDIDVDVLLPSGAAVSCKWDRSGPSPYYKTVPVYCPTVPLDAIPSCDSAVTIELRPRSSTYADANTTQALCAGSQGRQLDVSVPVLCVDSCGSPSNGGSCAFLGQSCSYTALGYGGGGGTFTGSLPCSCTWNESLDRLAWSCAVY